MYSISHTFVSGKSHTYIVQITQNKRIKTNDNPTAQSEIYQNELKKKNESKKCDVKIEKQLQQDLRLKQREIQKNIDQIKDT